MKLNKHHDWMLDFEELILVRGKKQTSQLAFAVMLKFFQTENKFPSSIQDMSEKLIEVVSNQLNISRQSVEKFDWDGRAANDFVVKYVITWVIGKQRYLIVSI